MRSLADPPELLSVKQVARRFGVAEGTVWRWEKTGRIPTALRLSRSFVRWRKQDLEQFEDALAKQSTPHAPREDGRLSSRGA
jgi:predicted DNA-binding transcriptional regulator AlpA